MTMAMGTCIHINFLRKKNMDHETKSNIKFAVIAVLVMALIFGGLIVLKGPEHHHGDGVMHRD